MRKTFCLDCHKTIPVGQTRCQRCTIPRKPVPTRIRAEVYATEDFCHLCRKPVERKDRTLDHLIPVRDGGNNERNNLRLAHKRCNDRRGTKPVAKERQKYV